MLVESAYATPIDFSDPAKVAVETDAIIDRMSTPALNINLRLWTNEILPWFSEEGIVDSELPPARVRYVNFHGQDAIHVLGTTDCKRGVVSINARYANPVSSMYRSIDLVLTLTHELAHVQQERVCNSAPVDNVEASAQLMAFEVDAAMALDGNAWAARSLLVELRTVAYGVLQYDALRGVPGAQAELVTVRAQIYSPPEQAALAQLVHSWADDPVGREQALLRYDVEPYERLVRALETNLLVADLALPIKSWQAGERTPTNGTLSIDDLALFLDDARDLYP
jgi:hypothetical protein